MILAGVGCMEDVAQKGLQCTANDVGIASVTNLTIAPGDGCDFIGDTVTFTATYEILLTAEARYDIGIWYAEDGDPNSDGAYTGICTAVTLPYAPDPPWLDLDGTADDPGGVIQDLCGDIDATVAHNPLFPSITLTVACVDDDGNNSLDLPNCVSWRQPGANDLCTSPLDAYPGAPSKCKCEPGSGVPIPVPGRIIAEKVTKDWTGTISPTTQLFDFTLTGPGILSTTQLSSLDIPTDTFDILSGTYTLEEDFITFAHWDFVSANCVSDQGNPDQDPQPGGTPSNIVVNSGETLWCTFINQGDNTLAVTLASLSASGSSDVLMILVAGLLFLAVAAAGARLLRRRARVMT